MIVNVAVFTISVDMDIETSKPVMDIDIEVDPAFAFITKEPQLLVSWLERAKAEVQEKFVDQRPES